MRRLFFALSLITTVLCWSPLCSAFIRVQDVTRKNEPLSCESAQFLLRYFKKPSEVTAQEITKLHELLVSDSRFISDMIYGEIHCTLAHRLVRVGNLDALRELVKLEGSQKIADCCRETPLQTAKVVKFYPRSDTTIYDEIIQLLKEAKPRERPQVVLPAQGE